MEGCQHADTYTSNTRIRRLFAPLAAEQEKEDGGLLGWLPLLSVSCILILSLAGWLAGA